MFKSVSAAASSIFVVVLIISFLNYELVSVQVKPMVRLVKSMMLAGLGEETPGLDIEGVPRRIVCDGESVSCQWE